MGFWIYMTCIALLIPITIMGFGAYFIKTAPKNINYVFGYRTSRSMKNENTWKFAHNYCGKIWFKCGIIETAVSLIIMLCVLGKSTDIIGYVGAGCTALPIITMIVSVFMTEQALKKNFDK